MMTMPKRLRTRTASLIAFVGEAGAVLVAGGVLLWVLQLDDPEPWRVAAATAGFVVFAMLFAVSKVAGRATDRRTEA